MENVLDYLKRAAGLFPEKPALGDISGQLSYAEYWRLVGIVGNYIRQKGVADEERPIGVLAERSRWVPVLFMGVVYSGNFYVPINPQLPTKKREEMIKKAGIDLILTVEELRDILETPSQEEKTSGNEKNTEVPYQTDAKHKPLYMIYTSGSTGEPKGILKTHGAMLSFMDAFTQSFPMDAQEVIGNQTNFFFDASAKDVYLAMKSGALLEVLPGELFAFPVRLIEYLNEKKVTMISWVPSALRMVVQLGAFDVVKPQTLKRVFFVGEPMSVKVLNQWRQMLPEIQYVNLYGFSEIAGICCYYEIKSQELISEKEVLPIGRPLANCRVVLVELTGEAVIREEHVIGELYVSSEALAKEYFSEPEKTENSFVMREFREGTMVRYFKTGDTAFYTEKGELVFDSRVDFQIKHRGIRIEPAEIEREVLHINGIQNCACIYDEKKQQLVLFYECQESSELTAREIKMLLKQQLPQYMIPNRIEQIEKIPLNSNGKTDRMALKS